MKNVFAAVAAAAALVSCSAHQTDKTEHSPRGLGNLTSTFSDSLEVAYQRQHGGVSTDCFPPALKAILAQIGEKFGTPPTVTSGHRPRAGSSQHTRCRAADIRVEGATPAQVAAVARSIKGVGGVGTYCHTTIVHVDVGPRRDWNWGCRRRR